MQSKWEEKRKIRIQSALFRAKGKDLHLNLIFVLSLAELAPPSSERWVGGWEAASIDYPLRSPGLGPGLCRIGEGGS